MPLDYLCVEANDLLKQNKMKMTKFSKNDDRLAKKEPHSYNGYNIKRHTNIVSR